MRSGHVRLGAVPGSPRQDGRTANMLAVLSAVTYVAAGGLYFVLVQQQGGVTMPSFLVVFELLLGGMALCSAASVLVRS